MAGPGPDEAPRRYRRLTLHNRAIAPLHRRPALGALGLLWSVGLALAAGCTTLAPPVGTESARRLAAGPYRVVRSELRLEDTTRPTPPNRTAPGASTRTLRTSIWAPQGAPGLAPLVVYSHGFSSSREEAAPLAEHLASYGWIVAAADFPLSCRDAPGGPTVRDVAGQVADVRFLVDSLLAPPPAAGLPLSADPKRVAAVGLSLGGLTTTLVAFHPDLRDPRLRSAVSIAGPAAIFTERFFRGADVPFLMIAGTDDLIVDYVANAAPILSRDPRAALLTLAAGSHVGFAGGLPWLLELWAHPDSLGCRALRRWLDAQPSDGNPLAPLGGSEQGIDFAAVQVPPCSREASGRAMRPRRQQILLHLAVRAFLESQLGDTPELRRDAWSYLARTLPHEASDATLDVRGLAAR